MSFQFKMSNIFNPTILWFPLKLEVKFRSSKQHWKLFQVNSWNISSISWCCSHKFMNRIVKRKTKHLKVALVFSMLSRNERGGSLLGRYFMVVLTSWMGMSERSHCLLSLFVLWLRKWCQGLLFPDVWHVDCLSCKCQYYDQGVPPQSTIHLFGEKGWFLWLIRVCVWFCKFCGVSVIVACLKKWRGILGSFGSFFVFTFLFGLQFWRPFVINL